MALLRDEPPCDSGQDPALQSSPKIGQRPERACAPDPHPTLGSHLPSLRFHPPALGSALSGGHGSCLTSSSGLYPSTGWDAASLPSADTHGALRSPSASGWAPVPLSGRLPFLQHSRGALPAAQAHAGPATHSTSAPLSCSHSTPCPHLTGMPTPTTPNPALQCNRCSAKTW